VPEGVSSGYAAFQVGAKLSGVVFSAAIAMSLPVGVLWHGTLGRQAALRFFAFAAAWTHLAC